MEIKLKNIVLNRPDVKINADIKVINKTEPELLNIPAISVLSCNGITGIAAVATNEEV